MGCPLCFCIRRCLLKVLKKFTKIFIGALFLPLSLSAYSKTVSSENAESSDNWLSNAYSNVMLRNYQEENKDKKNISTWHVRYTLGYKFFEELMSTQVVFGAYQASDNALVTDRGTRIETTFDLYSNDYYSFTPYVEVRFPKTGSSNIKTVLGVNQGLNYTFETGAGDFKFNTGYYFQAYFGTEPKVKVGDSKDFTDKRLAKLNLTKKKDNVYAEQKSANLEHEFSLGFKWSTPLDGLSFGLSRYMIQEFKPRMALHKASDTYKEVSGYKMAATNLNRLRMAYKFTDDTWFTFDSYLYDSADYIFVTSIGTTLF